ncbi:unnamed protein product [Lota lota]
MEDHSPTRVLPAVATLPPVGFPPPSPPCLRYCLPSDLRLPLSFESPSPKVLGSSPMSVVYLFPLLVPCTCSRLDQAKLSRSDNLAICTLGSASLPWFCPGSVTQGSEVKEPTPSITARTSAKQ